LEAETIRMTIDLYKGDYSCCGLLTAGGTESIFLATHSYREQGRERGITMPNVISCETAHVGIDKSCHYLGIELRKIKRTKDLEFNIKEVEAAIDSNTLFVYGSSPEYAFGNYDPIT
jgi:sphinganine-1-phosphate aldolase